MRKNKILVLAMILGVIFCLSRTTLAAENTTVDPAWLEKAINSQSDDKHPQMELVYEFAKAHPSEILPASKSLYIADEDGQRPYLNITTINLDEDKEAEHIMFIGQNYANTMFYVIKKTGKEWKIIHSEYLWLHNEAPELHLQNSSLQNRTFYIRYLHERGSGIWMFTYRFYKVIGGKTYMALEIPEEMNLSMWPSSINGAINITKLDVDKNENSSIYVRYSYEFSAGGTLFSSVLRVKDPTWEDFPILTKQENAFISFDWDDKKHRFNVNEPYNGAGTDAITPAQFDYFMNHFIENTDGDNDNANSFVPAFKKELRELSKSGNKEQKEIAKYLLSNTKTKK